MRNLLRVDPPACSQSDVSLAKRYGIYFQSKRADTSELLNAAYALRYQVYCLERQFESPSGHLGQLEVDEFDRQSRHGLVIHRVTGTPIGTARLILARTEQGDLPVQQLLRNAGVNTDVYFPTGEAAEVSRFAISKTFRRRIWEADQMPDVILAAGSERNSNLPCLGLVQILLRLSIDCRITYWAAMMEPKLRRMLANMGIHFVPIGPMVFHHGLRQPCFCYVPHMLHTLHRERSDYWSVVTNDGELVLLDGMSERAA